MEQQLRDRLERGIEDRVFPGAVLGVVHKDGTRSVIPAGRFTYEPSSREVEDDTVYDVASITKSIPTGALALSLIEEGRLSLEDPITKYLPEYKNNYSDQVKIRHLLTYSIILNFPIPGFSIETATPAEIRHNLLTTDLKFPPGEQAQYSNSPALLLAMVIEQITGLQIDVLGAERFFKPLGMTRTTFAPADPEAVPPTEIGEWRGVVQGVVHDETSFVLKKEGPSGCAGLFTNVPDLLTFIEMLLNDGSLHGKRYFSPEMVTQMHTNQLTIPEKAMGLGWEMAMPRFMGSHASPSAFGKTGFTGTLILLDPEREVGYALLSNRTYPQRSDSYGIDAVRRDISDMILSNV